MNKFIALCSAVVILSLQVYAQHEVEKISPDRKLDIMVPKGFTLVSTDMFESQLPAVLPKPLWMISYENGKLVLGCTHTEKKVDDNGIPAFTDQLIADVKATVKEVKLLDDGILLQDGKNIGYIKFMSQEKDQKIFNYMFYISLEEKLVLFNFECPKKLRKKWEAKAQDMAASLRLRL